MAYGMGTNVNVPSMSGVNFGGIVQGISSAAATALGIYQMIYNQQQNEKNMRQQNYANWLQLALQKEQWNREDIGIQRRVKDLQDAGLSPVLAAGSAASSSTPLKIEPTQSNPNLPKIPELEIGNIVMQMMMQKSAITKMNEETLRIAQARELDLLSFPEKMLNLKARTSNISEEAWTKAMDNAVYRSTGVSPRSASEIGRTIKDTANITGTIIDGLIKNFKRATRR